MLISCSFNSFRIFGHYISARFQIIWRPNLWLVSCTALISFLEFIILQISVFFPLLLPPTFNHVFFITPSSLSLRGHLISLITHHVMHSFLHGYVIPPPSYLPGLYCRRLILLKMIFILSLLSGCIFPYLRL